MADIRSYLKEKEKREQNQSDYKVKIRKHRLSGVYRVLLIVFALLALAVFVMVQYRLHIYTGYDIVSSIEKSEAVGAADIRLGDNILTYSKDGAHCTDQKGNVVWNLTYEIQNIMVETCQDMSAIADYNGRNIYVQSSTKPVGEITTTMPIRSISVSATGRVATIMADTDLAWIYVYDPKDWDNPAYKGEVSMQSSGYPAAVTLSPGGDLMMVSYIYVDAGIQKTNIVFYNLGPVGGNVNDRWVSSYTYSDILVPYIHFMNNDTAFAVGDNRLMFFKGSQIPASEAEYLTDQEIKSVFYNGDYVGLVFDSEDAEYRYRMEVYNNAARKVGNYYMNIDYTDIIFNQDIFIAYNESACIIMNMDGIEKYNGGFNKSVRLIQPLKSAYKYLLVTNTSIDTIQLK